MKLMFISKHHETDNIYSFQFKPLEPVIWIAGQSIRLEINGHERRFSIVSAPFEINIAIATRISHSKFKQALIALKPGEEIDGYNVEGNFVWGNSPKKHVLIAGGIGITPYISMLKQRDFENQAIESLLIYTSHNDQFAFSEFLNKLAVKHSGLHVEMLPSQRFSIETAQCYIAELIRSLIYISGPEKMVNSIAAMLITVGIKEKNIRRDLFTGYKE